MSKKLKDAYSLNSLEDTINLYKAWSKNYDCDFAQNNYYKSPQNVVKYFLKYSRKGDSPILDVGAGTGLISIHLKKYSLSKIHAIDISKEMLDQAEQKNSYEKIIVADLNQKLKIADNVYGAILSAGTFTHGHLGPNIFGELLRIVKPGGLFVITIHEEVFLKNGFKKALEQLGKRIESLKFHKVNIYGKMTKKEKNKDKTIITIFRKAINSDHL
tara:strand:+ start:123 stop:767 length:645 start_codon:yes stop_codon:yes gene_type:complete